MLDIIPIMNYYKTKLLTNCELLSIISKPDWVTRDYLVTDRNSKSQSIIYYAGIIQEFYEDAIVSINTKFKYAFRDARLEIVVYLAKTIYIIKNVTSPVVLDKECLKLDLIISAIKWQHIDLTVVGYILVDDAKKYSHIYNEVNTLLSNEINLLSEEDILSKKIPH